MKKNYEKNRKVVKFKDGTLDVASPRDIIQDPDVYQYHRTKANWQTIAKYTDAMRLGNVKKFPPICVLRTGGRLLVCLDGWMTAQAAKTAKVPQIAVMYCDHISPGHFTYFVVQRHTEAKRPLSTQERRIVAFRMMEDGIDMWDICQLVTVSEEHIDTWMEFLTYDPDGNVSAAKAATEPALGTKYEQKAIDNSGLIANRNVNRTLDEMLGMLNGRLVDIHVNGARDKIKRIHLMLGELLKFKPRRRKEAG